MERIILLFVVLITANAAPLGSEADLNDTATVKPANVSVNSSDWVILIGASKYKPIAVTKNCSLIATDTGIPALIRKNLAGSVKLIKHNIVLDDGRAMLVKTNQSLAFKPFYWVRTTGRQGTGLLLLRNEFDVLSLMSLSIGVQTIDVTLTETPKACLNKLSEMEVEMLLRETVMNDFQNTSEGTFKVSEMTPNEKVCNMHIRDTAGVAEFRYYCCNRDSSGHLECEYLYEDSWLTVLFFVIGFLKAVVILFSPRLVPGSFYRVKYVAAPYIYRLKEEAMDAKQELSVVLTKYPEHFTNALNRFKLSKFKYFNNFKNTIQTLRHDVPYRMVLEDLHIKIKADRLLPEDYAPVGLLQTLYETLIKCNIRKRSALVPCCTANVLSTSPCDRTITWYKLLKKVMMLFLLVAIATPWIIRIAVYYAYEHTEMDLRRKTADEKSLRFYFPGNFTLLLTPLHMTFVIIYVLLTFESCIYGVLSRKVKEKFKFVLRKCFRDMREKKRGGVIGWAVKLALTPCTKFGGFGLCFGAVIWLLGLPFITMILAFYLIPTLNITLRLFAHFALYLFPQNTCHYSWCKRISDFLARIENLFHMEEVTSEENLEKNHLLLKSGRGRLQQLIVITLCLISLYSVIFLLLEIVSFTVEIVIHTLIGVIINASVTLTYVSLALLLGLYANDCFGYVTKHFLAFNKLLNGLILGLNQAKCEDIMYSITDNQENLAFRVNTTRSSIIKPSVKLVKDSMGYPRWRFSRLLLFLSKNDVPHIPKTFYFDACKMPFYAVPGELLLNYLRASLEFGAILVFLLFVLVVVLAFGDTYELSASNQLLATVAGGFVPFMLRKVVFKTHTTPTVDTASIQFQVCFNDLLDNYSQSWPIHDIIVKQQPRQIERQQSVYFDCLPDTSMTEVTEANNIGEQLENETSPLTGQPRSITAQSSAQIDLLIDVNEIDVDEFPAMEDPNDS